VTGECLAKIGSHVADIGLRHGQFHVHRVLGWLALRLALRTLAREFRDRLLALQELAVLTLDGELAFASLIFEKSADPIGAGSVARELDDGGPSTRARPSLTSIAERPVLGLPPPLARGGSSSAK
jgi:hypothetical protein